MLSFENQEDKHHHLRAANIGVMHHRNMDEHRLDLQHKFDCRS